jgi:hypothetical protein
MDLCSFPDCGHPIPVRANACPHCGRPGLFPNVRAATRPDEVAALDQRYADTRRDADARGCGAVADALVLAVSGSRAVIARPLGEIERLARSEAEVYSTYYKQVEAELRLPDASAWDPLRRVAEEALFPGYKEDIRFAALTLDDRGLASYGRCFFTLRPSMTAHRTTVFEENDVLFVKKRNLLFSQLVDFPKGFRATWDDRGKLCLAKLGGAIQPSMTSADFAGLILRPGATTADDDFVEVHVWGPITIRAIEKVALLDAEKGRAAQAKRRAWGEKLRKQYGVILEGP